MESSIEIVQDKKVKKWIRYPITFFLALFIIAVLITIMYVGIMFLMDEEINIKLAGALFIIFDIILIISAIKKVSKIIKDDNKDGFVTGNKDELIEFINKKDNGEVK